MAGGTGHTVGDNTTGEGPSIEQSAQGLATASDVRIIDDFEDENLDEYNAVSGSKSDLSFNQNDTINGNNSLEITDPDGNSGLSLLSTSGLNYYPKQGDQFEYYFKFLNTGFNHNFEFGVQSESNNDNLYFIQARESDNNFRILIKVNGNFTELVSGTPTIDTGIWYRVEVDWSNTGDINLKFINNSNGVVKSDLSTTDTTYTDGGIGFGNGGTSSGDTYLIDYTRTI